MNLPLSAVLSLWAATAVLHGNASESMTATMVVLAALAGASIVLSPPLWLRVLSRRRRPADAAQLDRLRRLAGRVCATTGAHPPRVRLVPGANATFTRAPWGTRTLAVGRRWADAMDDTQLLGIIAHEFGHDRDDHLWHHAAVNAGGVLLTAVTALGSTAVVVSYQVLWLDPVQQLPQPTVSLLLVAAATVAARAMWELQVARPASRTHERQADAFAIEHGFGDALAHALASEHVTAPAGPAWLSSHPPLAERIAACRSDEVA